MRKKYCALRNKAVYAKTCLDCGKLKEAESQDGTVYDCEHLFEKVVFIGPHTDTWRKRFGQEPEHLPVGKMEKYRYPRHEVDAYSGKTA